MHTPQAQQQVKSEHEKALFPVIMLQVR